MLAMGRALMSRPRLLMLDEPSLGLAPLIVRDIFEIIVGLKQTGVSILLVEQNARAALQVADYASVMELGEITAQGPAAHACRRPAHRRELPGIGRGQRLTAEQAHGRARAVPLPSHGERVSAVRYFTTAQVPSLTVSSTRPRSSRPAWSVGVKL